MTLGPVRAAFGVALALSLAGSLLVPAGPASAAPGDDTADPSLSLAATYEAISVYASFSGDDNSNNSARLEWRRTGQATWIPGIAMTPDRRTTVQLSQTPGNTAPNPYVNQWRASIFKVLVNTEYEVRVTFSDPDGVTGSNPLTATIRTRDDNPPSTGNTYYVALTGSDADPGTEAAPFRTIQRAVNAVAAGDTVLIEAGTYAELVTITGKAGTADNWITFRNFGSDEVTIDGEGTRVNNLRIGQDLEGAHYIRLKGLQLINATTAISINLVSTDIIIEDSTIEGYDSNAIRAGGSLNNPAATANITIQRNTIRRTKPKPASVEGHAISFWRTSGGHVIRDNTIIDVISGSRSAGYRDGIGGGSNFGIDGFVHKDSDIYNNYISGPNDDGIEAEGGDVNVRVWNNIIENVLIGIAVAPKIVGPIYIVRNAVWITAAAQASIGSQGLVKLGQGGTGFSYFYHNTFYTNGTVDGFKQTDQGLGNVISRNNIIRSGQYIMVFNSSSTPGNFDYDALYTTDVARFVNWGGTRMDLATLRSTYGQELNGINIDSQGEFVDAASGNFNLNAGSQLIDRGVLIPGINDANSSWPYAGAAPDVGAYEHPSGGPTPAAPPTATPVPPTPTPAPIQPPGEGGGGNSPPKLTPTPTPSAPPAPAQVTQTIVSRLTVVWSFNPVIQMWEVYDPAAPGPANNLTAFIEGRGYWIHVSALATLTYGGKTRNLMKGWNLIGW